MNLKFLSTTIIAVACSFSLIGGAAAQKDMTSAPGTTTTDEAMTSAPGTTSAPGAMTTAPGTNTPAEGYRTGAPGTNPSRKPMRSPAPGPNAAPGAITTAPGMGTPTVDSNDAVADTAQSRLIASGWRVSKLNKTAVYNDTNQKIGKIEDFIVTKDGSLTFAVVNLGRFPGRGTYMVAIPMNDFSQIVPKVILPGKTKADLRKLPRFEYKLILGK